MFSNSVKRLQYTRYSRPLRILLVEDHSDTRNALEKLLQRWGSEVLSAGDVRTALEKGLHEDFDVLVSDLGLPDGSGWELAEVLRREKHCPAIAMSGLGSDQDLLHSVNSGFSRHIVKPFDPNELYDVLHDIGEDLDYEGSLPN